jgi:hypothetical protein
MKHFLTTLKTIAASIVLVAAVALPTAAADVNPKQSLCEGSGGTWDGTSCATPLGQPQVVTTFNTVSNILLFLAGAVAVVMIIIGGIRYVTSNGDQNQITGAKNTIMYAVIGVIVTICAYAIINFVTAQLNKSAGATKTTQWSPRRQQI